ncbi:MAG TPA: hypothetical protein VFL14_01400 [Xanthomonadales bacterium]|nr:hypothetical protein [Xanthomonadales bacterium]
MNRHIVLAALTTLALSAPAFAENAQSYETETGNLTVTWGQPDPDPRSAQGPSRVEELDTNGDGAISEAEAEANIALINDFIHADLNEDGLVSQSELDRWE